MPGDTGSTEFRPAGLQTQGLFSPTVTQLHFTPVTYANYAPMLQAIEAAGSNILHYLNPETIAKMHMEVASSQAGRQFLAQADKDGTLGAMGYVSDGKFGVQPLSSTPWGAAKIMQVAGKVGDGGGGDGKVAAPTVPPAVSNQGDGQQQTQQQPVHIDTTPTDVQRFWQGDQGTTLNFQQGGQVPQQTPSPQYFSAPPNATPPPPMPVQAFNPTPYAPTPQQQANAPLQQANAPQMQANAPIYNPAFSPTPYAPAQQQQQPQMTPSPQMQQAVQQQAQQVSDQQNLQQWQNKSQGQPLGAKDVLKFVQENLDTAAKRIVYLPNGGPPGANGQREPAYGIYNRDGQAPNIVPLSQLRKAGAGPLIAANNTSQVLNAADMISQQQQPNPIQQANAAAGGMAGAQAGASPPGMNMPPAAPSSAAPGPQVPQQPGGGTNWGAIPGQLPQDEMDRRIAAATNVQSRGGPPASQLMASNDAVTGEVLPTSPTQQEIDNYAKTGSGQKNGYGDPQISQTGNFSWYRAPSGVPYTYREGQQPFQFERYWLGDSQWRPWMPDAQYMKDKLNQVRPDLGTTRINGMGEDELHSYLLQDYNLKNVLPQSPAFQHEPEAAQGREDILQATRALNAIRGQDPQEFNFRNQDRNNIIRNALSQTHYDNPSMVDRWNNFWAGAWRGLQTGSDKENERVTQFTNAYDYLMHRQLNLPQGQPLTPAQKQQADASLGGVGTGTPTAIPVLERYLGDTKKSFAQIIDTSLANRERVPKIYSDANNDLQGNIPWFDKYDKYAPKVDQNPNPGPTPNPSPNVPAAPGQGTSGLNGLGSSKQTAILVTSDAQRDAIMKDAKYPHGTWLKDEYGNPIQKP